MKGLYEYECAECGDLFWGRKNRIYCDDKCRHRKNNRAAEARREINSLTMHDIDRKTMFWMFISGFVVGATLAILVCIGQKKHDSKKLQTPNSMIIKNSNLKSYNV